MVYATIDTLFLIVRSGLLGDLDWFVLTLAVGLSLAGLALVLDVGMAVVDRGVLLAGVTRVLGRYFGLAVTSLALVLDVGMTGVDRGVLLAGVTGVLARYFGFAVTVDIPSGDSDARRVGSVPLRAVCRPVAVQVGAADLHRLLARALPQVR